MSWDCETCGATDLDKREWGLHFDITGVCVGGGHAQCHYGLRTATGFHWWCACPCHPVPKLQDLEDWQIEAGAEQALTVFHKARKIEEKRIKL